MVGISSFATLVECRAQHCVAAWVMVSALLSGCAAAGATDSKPAVPVAASPASVNVPVSSESTEPPSDGVDVTVTHLSWSPAHPKAGQPLTFSATVKNRGTAATEEGTVIGVAFQINGMTVSWSDTSKASLGPGQSRTLTANFGPGESATWTAVSGEHTLSAWVDDVKRLPDTNRNNDSNETALVVQ